MMFKNVLTLYLLKFKTFRGNSLKNVLTDINGVRFYDLFCS